MQECGKPQPHTSDTSACHTLAFLSTHINYMSMKVFLLIVCLAFSSCMTGKIADKTGIEEIKFGSGGGFTGEVKTYTLTADNKILEKEKVIKQLSAKETLKFFKEAQKLKDYELNEPENMYSFLEIKTSGKTNRIVWAFGSTKVDAKAIELYKELMMLPKL